MKSPAIGILLGVVGSIGINVGMNLQSIGANALPDDQKSKPWKSRLWLIGMVTFLACTVANFLAFMFAAASILVPLESIQLVSNVIFNRVVNKVKVPFRLAFGSILVVVGTVCVVGFGEKHATQLGINEVIHCWEFLPWWLYLGLSFGTGALAMLSHAFNERRHAKGLYVWQFNNVQPILFSYSSGITGAAQTIVHAKAASELVYDAAARPDVLPQPLTHWLFYVELFLVALFGVWWIVRQNQGLVYYDPLLIIPLMQAMYIVFGACSSGIFFREFWELHNSPLGVAGGWTLFLGGVVLVVIGLYFICPNNRERTVEQKGGETRSPSKQSTDSVPDHLRDALTTNLDRNILFATATMACIKGSPSETRGTHSPSRGERPGTASQEPRKCEDDFAMDLESIARLDADVSVGKQTSDWKLSEFTSDEELRTPMKGKTGARTPGTAGSRSEVISPTGHARAAKHSPPVLDGVLPEAPMVLPHCVQDCESPTGTSSSSSLLK